MKLACIVIPALYIASLGAQTAETGAAPLFHHLHLNSTNPEAAINFYVKQFPSTSKATFAGLPALKAGGVYVLFNKVNTPPAIEPQTALWHFGWHVLDVRKNLETYQKNGVTLLPLFASDEGGEVWVSSDALPGASGTLGRTKAQLAEGKANGLKPAGGAGFAYLQGPDRAIVEYQGNMPTERFNHVHMHQEEPACAVLWYQKHLNAKAGGRAPQRTEDDCKVARGEPSWPALEREGTVRSPSGGVSFGDVSLLWYSNPGKAPLVGSRGHVADHIGLSVTNLDDWMAKLRAEGVKFLAQPYKLGEARAVMIEGPSKEAIELIEIR